MKRILFILATITAGCFLILAQKIEVAPDGATLIYTTGTNTARLTRPELKSYESNIVLQISFLEAQLREVRSFLSLADTLKLRDVPLPAPPKIALATTNSVGVSSTNVPPTK
jgi:hypothetical protein